jgi:hypothetical protein
MQKIKLLSFAALALALHAGPLFAAQDNSVNIGFGGLPRAMPHCAANVYSIEYERAYDTMPALLLRGSGVNYRFDNGNYEEDGRIQGVDVGARHYFSGKMEGMFIDSTLGYWTAKWGFMRMADPNLPQGTARSHSIRLNIGVGDRIPIADTNFSLMPEANIGKFFTSSSCSYAAPTSFVGTPCGQQSEVNAYLFVGITAGMAF